MPELEEINLCPICLNPIPGEVCQMCGYESQEDEDAGGQ
jgi:hypothetical protein